MHGISFENAKLSDSLRISILLKTVYIQTYAVEGITFEFSNFITKNFAPEAISQKMKTDPEQLLVAFFNGNPVGVAEILFDSRCPIGNKTVAELSKLYVLERFYGKGVGYGLLKVVEQTVFNKGGKDLNLEVYVENSRAIHFYKRQGFVGIGKKEFPMETNTYENLVMHKTLA